jgi:diguanylate cyclase (GGDEF)-like protein
MTMPHPSPPSTSPLEAISDTHTEVRVAQLGLLAERTLVSVNSSFIGIALIVITQINSVAWQALMGFVVSRFLSMAYNRHLCRQIHQESPAIALTRGRLSQLEWGLFVSGLTWGLSTWLLLPNPIGPSPAAHALVILLVGVSGVMMNTAALTRRAIQLFMGGIWIPPILRMLWSYDDAYTYFLLAGFVTYAGLSLLHGFQLYAQTLAGIRAVVENRSLLSVMTQQGQALAEANAQLATALTRAQDLASFDELTGLLNRRAFHERLRIEIAAQRRHGEAATLILLDLDHFKAINDQHGHQVGDAVLRLTAQTLKGLLREADLLARWGGEEFLILMPRTGVEEGCKAAERLRMALENAFIRPSPSIDPCADPVEHLPPDLRFSASFGVAEMHAGLTLDTALSRADQALYVAKAGGRNRVHVSRPPLYQSPTPNHTSSFTPWA